MQLLVVAEIGALLPRRRPCLTAAYLTCAETSLVISNMVTWFLLPKTAFSASSALMLVFFGNSFGTLNLVGVMLSRNAITVDTFTFQSLSRG